MNNMMVRAGMVVSAVAAGALLSGCAPKLAETPYGATEQQWKKQIQSSYSDWAPPETPPPLNPAVKGGFMPVAGTVAEPADIPEPVVIEEASMAEPLPEIVAEKAPAPEPTEVVEVEKILADDQAGKEGKMIDYVVQKGDSLTVISKKLYGTANRYKLIYEANRDVIKDKNNLRAGVKLRVPAP